jgi:hypothetical protein
MHIPTSQSITRSHKAICVMICGPAHIMSIAVVLLPCLYVQATTPSLRWPLPRCWALLPAAWSSQGPRSTA